MLYIIIEHFKNHNARPVYERFRERGRLAPDGLNYVSSWVTADLTTCYQVMECDDRQLLDLWIERWQDLVDFEVRPAITSAQAAEQVLSSNTTAASPSVPPSHNPHTRPKWLDRRFRFDSPLWMLAEYAERLRGTVHRLRPLLVDLPLARARDQVAGSWSILQNAGHLGDVEELWLARVEDLRARRAVFAPAQPDHFRRLAEAHQSRSVDDTLHYLVTRRAPFLELLDTASASLQHASAFHERLECPMRLVDLAQFAAEHDDHHLLRIRELRRLSGSPAGGC